MFFFEYVEEETLNFDLLSKSPIALVGSNSSTYVMSPLTQLTETKEFSRNHEIAPSGDIPLILAVDDRNNEVSEASFPYDPYEHRFLEHPLTYTDALCHMIKGSIGTGILTVPHAFKNSGYLLGFVGTLSIGAFMTYNVQTLVRAQHELCCRLRIPSLTYPQILGTALSAGPKKLRWLAPYGRFVSFTALALDELGTMCIYVVFIAQNLRQICNPISPFENLRLYMISLFPMLLVLSWIPNLKNMAPISSGAICIMFASLGLTLYTMLHDIPSLKDRRAVGEFEKLPFFFCTILYSCSSIAVTMPLENEMGHPRQFSSKLGVLNIANCINTLLFASFGFLGYLKYGDDVQGSITLNLPSQDKLTLIVQSLLTVAILFTLPLPQFIFYDIVWNGFLKPRISFVTSIGWDYGARTLVVLLTVTFAVIIPNLELFVSLIGGLCLGLMTLVIPATVDLLTFWDQTDSKLKKVGFISRNVFTIVLGVVGSGTGIYFSIKDIVKVYDQA